MKKFFDIFIVITERSHPSVIKFSFLLIGFLIFSGTSLASDGVKDLVRFPDNVCKLRDWGLEFSCSQEWEVKVTDNQVTMFVISKNPYVTMTIANIETNCVFLEQLNQEYFESKNLYAEHFQIERTQFAGQNALKIKAYSKMDPEMRFLSFFFFTEDGLANVLFTVYPKSYWDDYQAMIKKISESFTHFKKDRSTNIRL